MSLVELFLQEVTAIGAGGGGGDQMNQIRCGGSGGRANPDIAIDIEYGAGPCLPRACYESSQSGDATMIEAST
jgi:hypothetical protein